VRSVLAKDAASAAVRICSGCSRSSTRWAHASTLAPRSAASRVGGSGIGRSRPSWRPSEAFGRADRL